MPVSLFEGPHECWSSEALEVDRKVSTFMRALLAEYADRDYRLRDMEYIAHNAVAGVTAEMLLRNRHLSWKAAKT